MTQATITLEIDYHPAVGLDRVEQLLDLIPNQYGIREATITYDEATTRRKNRPQLSLERRSRQRRNRRR